MLSSTLRGIWALVHDHRLFLALAFLSLPQLSEAALQNRTIDDEAGDSVSGRLPVYTPASEWAQGSTCEACDISRAIVEAGEEGLPFDKTWHDATYNANNSSPVSFTLEFNGTAIYVFCITANQVPFTTTLTNLSFTLDNEVVGTFVHIPDQTENFGFNTLVYSNHSLQNAQHTLVAFAEGTVSTSLVLFDYAIYTFDTDPITTTQGPTSTQSGSTSPTNATSITTTQSSTSKHTDVGAIAGGVVGGVAALVALVVAYLFCLRRNTRKERGDAIEVGEMKPSEIEPFMVDPDVSLATSARQQSTFLDSTSYVAGASSAEYPSSSLPTSRRPAPSSNGDSFMDYYASASTSGAETSGVRVVGGATLSAASAASSSGATVGTRNKRNLPSPPGSKAALRQRDLDAQVRNIQREVTILQARRSQRRPYAPPPPSSADSASVYPPSSEGEADESLRTQIEVLRQEVERLQAERDAQAMWSDEPPPEYVHPDEEEEDIEGEDSEAIDHRYSDTP